jgi:actin-related protein
MTIFLFSPDLHAVDIDLLWSLVSCRIKVREEMLTSRPANIIGQYKDGFTMAGVDSASVCVGKVVVAKRKNLNITRRIEHGVIQDWDGRRKIGSIFSKMSCELILRIEMSFSPNPQSIREEMVTIAFEEFGVPPFTLVVNLFWFRTAWAQAQE